MASELPDVQSKLGAADRERKLGLPVQNWENTQQNLTQLLDFLREFRLFEISRFCWITYKMHANPRSGEIYNPVHFIMPVQSYFFILFIFIYAYLLKLIVWFSCKDVDCPGNFLHQPKMTLTSHRTALSFVISFSCQNTFHGRVSIVFSLWCLLSWQTLLKCLPHWEDHLRFILETFRSRTEIFSYDGWHKWHCLSVNYKRL